MPWDTTRPKLNGYGRDHQAERRRRAQLHQPTDPCVRCGQPLGPMGPHLHLDHDDHDRRKYLGFAHRACNIRAGALKANAAQRTTHDGTGCRWCGRKTRPGRVFCSRRCGWLGTRTRTRYRQLQIDFPPADPIRTWPARQCRLCGVHYSGNATFCTQPCADEYARRQVRELYRHRHGKPPTWHIPSRGPCGRARPIGMPHEVMSWDDTSDETPITQVTHRDTGPEPISVTEWIKRSQAQRGA